MSFWTKVIEVLTGPKPSMQEVFPPSQLLEHKDHIERCPECKKHYLCREVVCRFICARCARSRLQKEGA